MEVVTSSPTHSAVTGSPHTGSPAGRAKAPHSFLAGATEDASPSSVRINMSTQGDSEAAPARPIGEGLRAVLIDDEAPNRRIGQRTLQRIGFQPEDITLFNDGTYGSDGPCLQNGFLQSIK